MEFSFSSARNFSDSFKVFGFSVTLLYIFGKKSNIFNIFRFSATILALLFAKLMQHMWFRLYQLYIYTGYLLGKFGPKLQNWIFKLKFGTMTNSNLKNSIVMFTFSVFDRKHPFWANLVQKFKVVCLKWNLVPRPIRICRIQWGCSTFCFRRELLFLGKFDQKFDRFRPEIHFFSKFAPGIQNWLFKLKNDIWCYLINLPAVYSQRL